MASHRIFAPCPEEVEGVLGMRSELPRDMVTLALIRSRQHHLYLPVPMVGTRRRVVFKTSAARTTSL